MNIRMASKNLNLLSPFTFVDSLKDDNFKSLNLKNKFKVKKPEQFGDNWSDILDKNDKKIIIDYFNQFEELNSSIGFINFVVGKKELNLKFEGPKNKKECHLSYLEIV